MNSKFAKALLMGSVLTMGAFGLVACGDDSSSSPKDPSGPGAPITVPTTQDDLIQFTNLNIVDAGSVVKLTGSAILNAADTSANDAKIVDVSFKVGKVTPSGLQTTTAEASVANMPNLALGLEALTFTEMGVLVDLANPALTECGDFQLIITVKASDGKNDFENTQTIAFKRPEAYCAVSTPASSSSSEPATVVSMMVCPEIAMSTNLMPGLDLATCTASASTTADIVLTKAAGGDFNVTSGNGTLFSVIDNETMTPNDYKDDYGVGYWPEVVNQRDALMTDFKYKAISGTSLNSYNENYSQAIFVAKTAAFNEATGAGFFAVAVTKATEGNNGDFNVTLKVYKAK